ncbi:hypothetical protein PFISCL1PPCAC_15560, partial [Pristionchus fissidentatus]
FAQAAMGGRIEVPRFDGDFARFGEFVELFESLFGGLDEVSRLGMLMSSLDKEPKRLISGLRQVDRNYRTAMVILKKEYDKPHLLRLSLLTRLRLLPDCDPEGRRLRETYLTINELIYHLAPEGETDGSEILSNIILSKLPPSLQTRIIIQSNHSNRTFGMFDILSCVSDEVERERIEDAIRRGHSRPARAAIVPPSTTTITTKVSTTSTSTVTESKKTLGIKDSPKEDDESRCLQLFKDLIRFDMEERRFYCDLPFKVDPSELPSNFGLAFRRLQTNIKNLVNSPRPNRLEQYHKIFMEQLEKNIIEDVPANEYFKTDKVHYLAHHAVVKESSNTTKVRPVLDKLPVFIENRVKKICEMSPSTVFKHIDGERNPADCGSRGITAEELSKHPLWWSGPQFWKEPEDKWPQKIVSSAPVEVSNALVAKRTVKETQYAPLVDTNRFSRWNRLLRTMMFVLIFLTRFSKEFKKKFGSTRTSLLIWSEVFLFRQVQQEFPPSPATQRQLRLFVCPSTGLWRCRGRIANASLPEETKNPIYLPRESRINRLYILFIHESLNHAGNEHTLVRCRENVWIPQCRTAVRSTLLECRACKRRKAVPFGLPEFPSLPSSRTTVPAYPFERIGMDFAGPLKCKIADGVVKVWILLITCLSTRAVYLDVVPDDELDRGQWKLAEVIDSRDDYTRSATVRLASGSTLSRPISKLYGMELRREETAPSD